MNALRIAVVAPLVALALGGAPVAHGQAAATTPRDTTPVAVVRDYVAAFNAKELDAMMARVATDFTWMSVAGDSLAGVGHGVAAFRSLIAGYFREVPSARSTLLEIDATGPWVTTHERTRWEMPSGAGGQASVVVYEVRGGVIRRAWFYPALE